MKKLSKRKTKKKKKLTKKQKALLKEELRGLGQRFELRPTQKEGIQFIKDSNYNCIIADSMGTGKTAQVLVALAQNASKMFPALVVCPSSVAWNWRREAYQWLRSSVRCHVVDGMEDRFPSRMPHITVVSWDLLHHRIEEFKVRKYRCIVADEAHYAKNPDSLRSKALSEIDVNHRILMTGTPLINVKAELEVLKALVGIDGDVPILRRLLEEVDPNVPPKTRIVFPVEMEPSLMAEYEEVESSFSDWLNSYLTKIFGSDVDTIETKVESAMKTEYLAKISYLRRIVARGKIPACAVWCRQMVRRGDSVCVYGEHQDILNLFCDALRKLSIGHVRIDGSTSRTERQIAIDSFQKGNIKVFVGSRAAIEGITLTKAQHLAFLERYFTPAAEEQAEDRIRRMGQTKPTTIWYFTAQETIDERIQSIIAKKRRIIEREIGIEDIEEKEIFDVFDGWKRVSKLNGHVKPLKEEPMTKIHLPPLPNPKFVRGIFFGVNSWSIPMVLKGLRGKGFKVLEMQNKGDRVFVSTRAPEQFNRHTIRIIPVSRDLTCVVGKPASNAKRVKNYRG